MRKKYDWDRWFDGNMTVISRGVDYHCSQSTMVQVIRNKASSLGLKLSVNDVGTEILFAVVGRRGDEVPRSDPASVTGQREDELAEDVTD